MTSLPGFTVDIDQNPYLPVGGRDVSAIVTVTADATGDAAAAVAGRRRRQRRDHHHRLLRVDGLPAGQDRRGPRGDGGRSGRDQGRRRGSRSSRARRPPGRSTRRTGRWRSRSDAHPRGGQGARCAGCGPTAAPRSASGCGWRTRSSSPPRPRCGTPSCSPTARTSTRRPRSSPPRSACARASFRCDCRGVGTDWEVAELRKISTALLGTVDIVVDPAGLAADFEEMMRGAMSKQLPDVMLRVWTPQQADAKFVKQVAPGHRRPDRPPPSPVRRRKPATTRPAPGRRGRAATTTWASR